MSERWWCPKCNDTYAFCNPRARRHLAMYALRTSVRGAFLGNQHHGVHDPSGLSRYDPSEPPPMPLAAPWTHRKGEGRGMCRGRKKTPPPPLAEETGAY